MSRPDEGLIHTWLDGECSAEEAAHVERMMATDPDWAAAVAEARGLIAASSRIVSALDAVPSGVMPAGSKAAPQGEKIAPAAPEVRRHDGFRVQPWMKMAAGVVLVAGTAFAIRGTTRAVFTSPAADAMSEQAAAPIVAATTLAAPAPASTAAPTVSPAPTTGPAVARERSVAKAEPAAAPVLSAPISAEQVVAPVEPAAAAAAGAAVAAASGAGASGRTAIADERAERFAAVQRRMQNSPLRSVVVTTGTRGAEPERILDSPNSIAAVTRLEGCWNVTAPDSLRTVLRNPSYTRGNADSLVVEFVLGNTRLVTVLQNGDALGGEITAKRVECPKP